MPNDAGSVAAGPADCVPLATSEVTMVPDTIEPDGTLASEVIAIPAEPEEVGAVHAALARFWADLATHRPDEVGTRWQAEFETAVGEIVANVVRYAHPPNSMTGPVHVTFRLFTDRIEAHVLDRGIPFVDPGPRDGRGDTTEELPEGGWGLDLARGLLDDVVYERSAEGVNAWRLVKRFAAGPPAA